ncbi:uncharacterized protein LOC144434913 [Glandiceps talaboti]
MDSRVMHLWSACILLFLLTCTTYSLDCNQVTCVNAESSCDSSNNCICQIGWMGTACDTCGVATCLHGTCNSTHCECNTGWNGTICDSCSDEACLHGNCDVTTGLCECDEGWSGNDCTVCGSGTCIHGSCSSSQCVCHGPWTGDLCDECGTSLCVNGDCTFDDSTSTSCTCSDGWTGEHCDTEDVESGSGQLYLHYLVYALTMIHLYITQCI